MEFNQEYLSSILNVFKNKFELMLKVSKDLESKYEVIGVKNENGSKNKLIPNEQFGSYNDYLSSTIFKYIICENDLLKARFYFDNIFRFLDKSYEYSFDCDFEIGKEILTKRFSFFKESSNSFIFLIEDYTKYKLESFLNTIRITHNLSILYQVRDDEINYHAEYVSNEFAKLFDMDSNDLLKAIKKHHPFDYIDSDDTNKIVEAVVGNEKNEFNASFLIKLTVSRGTINVKVDITYIQIGKKLFAYCIFNDMTDVLKLHEVNKVLEETKSKATKLDIENKTDALTGLGNETKYKQVVSYLDNEIKNGFKDFAVCVCDVNGVKTTNDTYGHQYGCNLIVTAGHTFPMYFKSSEIFHIGGDEFVIIITGKDFKNLDDILMRVRNILDYQYMEYEGVKLRLSVAIGCSKYKTGDSCYHDAFQRADDDMYQRKLKIKKAHNIPMR